MKRIWHDHDMRCVSYGSRRARIMLLLVGFGSAVAARPLVPHAATSEAVRATPLRLVRPSWFPLTGQQIRSLFSDRILVLDEDYQPAPGVKLQIDYFGACPPTETFFADGRWQLNECQRARRLFEGHWTTDTFRGGERLCVEALDYPKQCRGVWQGSSTYQIIMAPASPDLQNDDPERFNPYRLMRRSS
jgi:hypothetical protein